MNSLQTFKLTHYYVGYSYAFSPPVSWTTPEDQTGVRVPTVFASLPLRFVGMLQSLSPFSLRSEPFEGPARRFTHFFAFVMRQHLEYVAR